MKNNIERRFNKIIEKVNEIFFKKNENHYFILVMVFFGKKENGHISLKSDREVLRQGGKAMAEITVEYANGKTKKCIFVLTKNNFIRVLKHLPIEHSLEASLGKLTHFRIYRIN